MPFLNKMTNRTSTKSEPMPTIRQSDLVVRTPGHLATPLGEGAAVLNTESGVYSGLNRTGAVIWEMLDEPMKAKDIAVALAARCGLTEQEAWADVKQFLESLVAEGLAGPPPRGE